MLTRVDPRQRYFGATRWASLTYNRLCSCLYSHSEVTVVWTCTPVILLPGIRLMEEL